MCHTIGTSIWPLRTWLKGTGSFFTEQGLTLGAESDGTSLGINLYSENVTHQGVPLLSDVYILRTGDDHQTLFGILMTSWRLDDMNDRRGVELHLHVSLPCL